MSPITLGILGSSGGQSFWATNITGGSNTFKYFSDILIGSDTNIYATGLTAQSGTNDAFLTKFDKNGSLLFQRSLGAAASDRSFVSALDSSNNLYIGGDGGFRFAKYNSSGTIQFQRGITSSNNVRGLATDSSGNFFVCGDDGTAVMLRKYNSAGTIQWQRRIADAIINERGYRCTTDSSGNIYATRNTRGAVIKFNTSGTVLSWFRNLNDTTNGLTFDITDVRVASNGDIYTIGRPAGSTGQSNNILICKLNSSGVFQWARRINSITVSTSNALTSMIVLDSQDNVYASIQGDGAAYLFKIDSSGTVQWQRQLTSSQQASNFTGVGIAVDNEGAFYATHYFAGGTFTNMGIVKLPVDGSLTKSWTLNSNTYTYQATSFTITSVTSDPRTTSDGTITTPTLADTTVTLTDAARTYTTASILL